MDIEFLYIMSMVIFLLLVLRITQSKKTDEIDLDLEISSYTIVAMIILVMTFTDDIRLVWALLLICIPYSGYGFYRRYKKDKKGALVSLPIIAAFLIVMWSFAL